MINENGKKMTEKEILKESLDLMANVLCLLFETKSHKSVAAAFMADSLIKYLQVIYRGDDVLRASADYTAYEEEVFQRGSKK